MPDAQDEASGPPGRANTGFIDLTRRHTKAVTGMIASLAAVGAIASGLLGYWNIWKTVKTDVLEHKAQVTPTPATAPAKVLSVGLAQFRGLGPNDQSLADGVRSALASDLSQVLGLTAVSAVQAAGAAQFTRPVQYILEVDLQSDGNITRANARLLGGADAIQVWGERFSIESPNAFSAQDIVAARLSNVLAFQLVRLEGERLAKRAEASLTAEELALLGRASLHKLRTKANLHESQAFFKQALAKDPDLVAALVGNAIALGYEAAGFPSPDTATTAEAARANAERAIKLAPASADAHLAMSQAYFGMNRIPDAGTEAEAAIAINPDLSQAYVQLASAEFRAGRFEQSIVAGLHALQINPNDPQVVLAPLHIGNSNIGLQHYEEALKWLRQMQTRNPYYWRTYVALASAYSLTDNKKQAHAALLEAMKLNPGLSIKNYREFLKSDSPVFAKFLDRTAESLRAIGLKEE